MASCIAVTDSVRMTSDSVRMTSDSVRMSSDSVRMTSDSVRMSSDSVRMSSDSVKIADTKESIRLVEGGTPTVVAARMLDLVLDSVTQEEADSGKEESNISESRHEDTDSVLGQPELEDEEATDCDDAEAGAGGGEAAEVCFLENWKMARQFDKAIAGLRQLKEEPVAVTITAKTSASAARGEDQSDNETFVISPFSENQTYTIAKVTTSISSIPLYILYRRLTASPRSPPPPCRPPPPTRSLTRVSSAASGSTRPGWQPAPWPGGGCGWRPPGRGWCGLPSSTASTSRCPVYLS